MTPLGSHSLQCITALRDSSVWNHRRVVLREGNHLIREADQSQCCSVNPGKSAHPPQSLASHLQVIGQALIIRLAKYFSRDMFCCSIGRLSISDWDGQGCSRPWHRWSAAAPGMLHPSFQKMQSDISQCQFTSPSSCRLHSGSPGEVFVCFNFSWIFKLFWSHLFSSFSDF